MSSNDALARIHSQIMWNRLIAVVEEQAQTLIRTAFSASVREAGDLSAGVFDLQGRMLAQAVTGTPGHVNSMAEAVGHFMRRYPIAQMHEGDHYLTNDPWLGTGHLHDFTLVSPTFYKGKAVALFCSTVHVVDVGGRGFGPDARQVYEEGLCVPIMPLARAGEMNQDLLGIVRINVREPVQVEGDLFSLVACNDKGSERLREMMAEFGIEDIGALADHIVEHSLAATLVEIRKLPPGVYHNAVTIDGYDHPIELKAALAISAEGIHVDFTGTSPVSGFGINVPMLYTTAYTSFGVKCLVAPTIPNNTGSLMPITVSAPEGSILNAPRPCAVAIRHVIGQVLPDVVFGCLHPALGNGAPAEGASALWVPQLRGGHGVSNSAAGGTDFNVLSFHSGGTGARPTKDGLSATAFPSGVRSVPVEIIESIAPVTIWRKEYRTDSGGAGRMRGGLGQVMEIASAEKAPFSVFAMFERIDHPASGRDGGLPGAAGTVSLASGKPMRGKGQQTIPPGERLRLELPGGGGFGDPKEREREKVERDVRDGLVSPEAAEKVYGIKLES
ncbi:MAG: hydantoinase B/oxoprolinase family protein [Acidiferrobacterales bacterium]